MNVKVREKETYISQIVEERNEFKRTLDQYVPEIIVFQWWCLLPYVLKHMWKLILSHLDIIACALINTGDDIFPNPWLFIYPCHNMLHLNIITMNLKVRHHHSTSWQSTTHRWLLYRKQVGNQSKPNEKLDNLKHFMKTTSRCLNVQNIYQQYSDVTHLRSLLCLGSEQ